MTKTSTMAPIESLRNLGPKSAQWLAAIDVYTYDDLQKLGPVTAYRLLQSAGYKVSLNLLYAMYGALEDLAWNQLPQTTKDDLIAALNDQPSPFA